MESIQTSESIQNSPPIRTVPSRQIIHLVIQLVALAFLLNYCLGVLSPFINLLIWAGIFAIALYPVHQRLKKMLNGRNALAAVIITVLMLLIFILPGVLFAVKTGGEVKEVLTKYKSGEVDIPPPGDHVKSWPLIGNKAYNLWLTASTDLNAFIQQNPERVKSISSRAVDLIKSSGKGILLLTVAIILSGVLLSYATPVGNFSRTFFTKLMNSSKIDMAAIATVTIRNVVKGILGVACIQSALMGLGLVIAGVPYAALWVLISLILAIVQIGTLPIAIGVIIYIWNTGSTTTAIILTIWVLLVGLLDNVLKPLVMGKGAPVPMLVIFLGAIGGFMYSGFIGMFTGAVILSLGYRLFDIWIKGTEI